MSTTEWFRALERSERKQILVNLHEQRRKLASEDLTQGYHAERHKRFCAFLHAMEDDHHGHPNPYGVAGSDPPSGVMRKTLAFTATNETTAWDLLLTGSEG